MPSSTRTAIERHRARGRPVVLPVRTPEDGKTLTAPFKHDGRNRRDATTELERQRRCASVFRTRRIGVLRETEREEPGGGKTKKRGQKRTKKIASEGQNTN